MTAEEIVAGMSEDEKSALLKGRAVYIECRYRHPTGTKCPNCSTWPYKKGGAAEFMNAVRAILESNHDRA